MIRYIIKRILQLIPVVLGVAILIFTLMYISPGDPAQLLLAGACDVVLAQPEQVSLLSGCRSVPAKADHNSLHALIQKPVQNLHTSFFIIDRDTADRLRFQFIGFKQGQTL